MVFLQPSSTESAFVFSTDDGQDAIVLDIKGVYALVDGGAEPLGFLQCLRTPTAAIVSTASPTSLTNAIELNKGADSLVAVVGNLPSPAAVKDAAAAEPVRELYKTLSVPPIVSQLKGSKLEPIVIHKGLSSGTLSVYTLAGDAKDAETVAKAYQSGSSESIEAAAAACSSVLLIVWEPARSDAPIKRILHLGCAPLPRIQQALDRARSLPFLQSAIATAASLKSKPPPSSSTGGTGGGSSRQTAAGGASSSSSARPSARVAPAASSAPAAKPAAKVAPATRPTARPAAPTARAAAATTARPSSTTRPSLPTRAVAPARPAAAAAGGASSSHSSSAARPARASTTTTAATTSSRPSAPAGARTARTNGGGGGVKEEVAKKTIIGKSAAAPSSSVRSSATSTPNGAASRTPSKATPSKATTASTPAAKGAATVAAATAAVAATAVAASAAVVTALDHTPPVSPAVAVEEQHQREEEHEETIPAPAAPAITVSIEDEGGVKDVSSNPGGLPVPASPTIIPATPQPPMSPEPEDVEEKEEPVRSPSPTSSPAAVGHVEDEQPNEKEEEDNHHHHQPLYPTLPVSPTAPVEEEEHEAAVSPSAPPAPLEPAASVDEPECVKELVEEEPTPTPTTPPVEPVVVHHDEPVEPEVVVHHDEPEPEPTTPVVPAEPEVSESHHDEPTPIPTEPEVPEYHHEEPTPVDPQEPHHDDKEEEEEEEDYPSLPVNPVEPEPTDDLIVVPTPAPVDPSPVGDLLGHFDEPAQPQAPGVDGLLDSLEEPMKKMQISMDTDKLAEELGLGGEGGDESLLDLTQASSVVDSEMDKTQTTVIESAHEFDDLLSPTKESVEEMQRKLSTQAEENLLTAAADPFIAGLVSHVVETATIDGAKQSQTTLESLMNNSRGVESPTGDKLLSFRSSGFENPDEPKEVKYEESDPAIDDVLTKLADESDMVNGEAGDNHHVELNGHGDGHHVVNGNGWPEGTTMHLPPPSKGSVKEAKFKLAGPVHVDLVTVPHRGKQILLNDEAASLEFFSSVRSSIYILQSGGDVPVHVLEGWKKGKIAWALNVPSRLVPTHHNDVIARFASENVDELAEVGLTVATPVDLTTLTYPDGQAKACTLVL